MRFLVPIFASHIAADFSLINRRIEENGVAEASAPWHYNCGFFAYNVLAGGVLTGKYLDEPPKWERAVGGSGDAFGSAPGSSSGDKPFRRFDDLSWGRTLYRYRSGPADAATREYAALANKYGLGDAWKATSSSSSSSSLADPALAELALRWCCSREAVTSVLLGSTSVAQLEQALAVFRNVGNSDNAAADCGLPLELMWEVDQVHMRNRLPIFSNDDIGAVARGVGAGGIGEPVP